MHRFLLPLQRRDAENAEENAEKTTQGLSSLFERAGGPRNFMKNRSNGRMGVRRDEVGKRSGEVEAVSLFDPEHARFERIIGRRWLPYGSLTAT